MPFARINRLLVAAAITTVWAILICNVIIDEYSAPFVYTAPDALPTQNVGLVLGTSSRLANGRRNLYFIYRMNAAAGLYHKGKIAYVIVSGDNATKYYNEPKIMCDALLDLGVPRERIYLDYAGFRTLDSIIRCRDIFGQTTFTVISQDFHIRRAIFIARKRGIHAIGYAAQDVSSLAGARTRVREVLSRVKAFIDLYLLKKQPKFGGEMIPIGETNESEGDL